MRVAVVAPPWSPVPPTADGPLEVVVDALCRGLRALGDDVLLCATGDSTCPVELVACTPAALGTGSRAPLAEHRHVVAAYDAIERWGAEIVNDHTLVGAVLAGWRSPVPVVFTNHGPFEPDVAASLGVVERRPSIVALSHDHAGRAGTLPIAAVIHPGIDVGSVRMGGGEGGYALFVGTMRKEVGAGRAIDIARRAGMPLKLAATMRDAEERRFFAEVVQARLGGDVEYVGEPGRAERLRLLRDATALLHPITWPEPFGLAMVEALACGTPVVAGSLGGVPEVVDDGITGRLARTVDRLADGLASVDQLGRGRCRMVAEQRFSHHRMAADHHRLFERLVDGRRRVERRQRASHASPSDGFAVSHATSGSGVRVDVRGEIDLATAPLVDVALRAALASESGDITIDLSAVDFLDCAGLRPLLAAALDLETSARRLVLDRPAPFVGRVLDMSRLSSLPNVDVVRGDPPSTAPVGTATSGSDRSSDRGGRG